jgi:hypothetical protein
MMKWPPKGTMDKNCGGKGKMADVDLWYLLTNAGGEMRQPPIEAAAEEATKEPFLGKGNCSLHGRGNLKSKLRCGQGL